MTQKTTRYSRKRQTGHTFNGAAWANAIQCRRSYCAEGPAPGLEGTASTADEAEGMVRQALDSLLQHIRPPDPELALLVLSHAIGVAEIRSRHIEPAEDRNPALPILGAGTVALQRAVTRYEEVNAWGMDGPGREPLSDAIGVYVELLRASTPAQMENAANEYRAAVLAQLAARKATP